MDNAQRTGWQKEILLFLLEKQRKIGWLYHKI